MKINSSRRHGQSNRGNRFPSKDSTIESVGPAGKVRGNLQHLVDRYMALGKEALGGRDFAEAESFFQHAEHYRRLLAQHKATKVPPKNAPSDDSGASKPGENAAPLKETPTTQRTAEAAAATEELPSFLVTSEAPKETAKEAPPKPAEEKPKTLKRTSVAARKTPSKASTSKASTRTASPKAEE
ncbi:MAG: DUF4167 domain-containing protein [Holosporaceae bacterium]